MILNVRHLVLLLFLLLSLSLFFKGVLLGAGVGLLLTIAYGIWCFVMDEDDNDFYGLT